MPHDYIPSDLEVETAFLLAPGHKTAAGSRRLAFQRWLERRDRQAIEAASTRAAPESEAAAALNELLCRLDLLVLANGDIPLTIHLAQVRAQYPNIPAPVVLDIVEPGDPRFGH